MDMGDMAGRSVAPTWQPVERRPSTAIRCTSITIPTVAGATTRISSTVARRTPRRTTDAAMHDHDVNEQLVQAAGRKLRRRGAATVPMVDPHSLLHLQRAAGNASVVALIEGARPMSLQRDDASTTSTSTAATKPDAGTAKAEVTINWGSEADSSTVGANSLEILKDVCRAAGVTSVTITSTARDATNQARVMYDNLESKGVAAQKALYGDNGDKVIDVYVDLKAKKKTADDLPDGAWLAESGEERPDAMRGNQQDR